MKIELDHRNSLSLDEMQQLEVPKAGRRQEWMSVSMSVQGGTWTVSRSSIIIKIAYRCQRATAPTGLESHMATAKLCNPHKVE
ncbi:hypothetical protein EVAR_10581_1 [Eumeta japonica]|uniref:Uncharacterized protein n=1 Tax=Eumeta variegata TaxID=151549 RepID=A0A4C1U207_EUMVA|nr:hypothetical protein EVAR_10581_1 [Eumeta japonica]